MRTALLLLTLTGCDQDIHDGGPRPSYEDMSQPRIDVSLPWPQPSMVPVPDFDELANAMLVAQAVREYTDERGTYLSFLYPAPYDDRGVGFIHPQHVLRKVVQEAWLTRQYPPHTEDAALTIAYNADWYFDWTAEVRDVARGRLRDPEVLKETYLTYKPVVVPILVTAKDRKGIIDDLNEAERVFTIPVSDELRRMHEAVSAQYEATMDADWDSPESEAFSRLEDTFVLRAREEGFPNTYLLQWRLRREAEGGPELVQAWVDILADLQLTVLWLYAAELWADVITNAQEEAERRRQAGENP